MTTKIRMKIGGVEIDYEGPEDFLGEKLSKLLREVSTLSKEIPAESGRDDVNRNTKSGTSTSLVSFLKEKKVEKSQEMRFLATAAWLHQKDSRPNMKLGDVTQALRSNQQKKLSNPSNFLRKNISKGYCEGDSKNFFVTDEGKQALG